MTLPHGVRLKQTKLQMEALSPSKYNGQLNLRLRLPTGSCVKSAVRCH
jgi:hypothetical protein